MELKNFLSNETVHENTFLRNRNLIKFILIIMIVSSCLSLLVQFLFLATNKFIFTKIDAITPEVRVQYEDAKKKSEQIAINSSNLSIARTNHISTIEVTNAAAAAMNDKIYIKNLNITKNRVSLIGEAKEIDSVNTFLEKFRLYGYITTLENVSNKDQDSSPEKNITFTITSVPAKGDKK